MQAGGGPGHAQSPLVKIGLQVRPTIGGALGGTWRRRRGCQQVAGGERWFRPLGSCSLRVVRVAYGEAGCARFCDPVPSRRGAYDEASGRCGRGRQAANSSDLIRFPALSDANLRGARAIGVGSLDSPILVRGPRATWTRVLDTVFTNRLIIEMRLKIL